MHDNDLYRKHGIFLYLAPMMHAQPTIVLELSIPAFLFEKCPEQPALLVELLTDQQVEQLQAFVFDSLADKDGTPEVENFRISFFKYNVQERSGSFRLHFYINRRFCCSDVESSREDYLDFQFSYINQTLKATASYFNWDVV